MDQHRIGQDIDRIISHITLNNKFGIDLKFQILIGDSNTLPTRSTYVCARGGSSPLCA